MPSIFASLDEGGRTLLARVYGGVPPPSFPSVALLSSLVSYGENMGVALQKIATNDVRIVFRRFDETLLVIVTNDQASQDKHLEDMLQLVYNSVILLSGQEALLGPSGGLPMPDTPQRDVDAVKRIFRGAVSMIDYILREDHKPLGLQVQLPEVVPVQYSSRQQLQSALQSLTADAATDQQSLAAAIAYQGCFVACNSDWASQNGQDLMLIQALVQSLPAATMRDIPIYLPMGNPNVPIRLLTAELTNDMELLLLAGPSPSLSTIPSLVRKHLSPVWVLLKDVANMIFLPASNMFPGFQSLEAVVVVQKHPPRCMAITAAAAAMQSSGFQSFFNDGSGGGSGRLQRPRAVVVDALVSFALCFSPLVPVGISEVCRPRQGFCFQGISAAGYAS